MAAAKIKSWLEAAALSGRGRDPAASATAAAAAADVPVATAAAATEAAAATAAKAAAAATDTNKTAGKRVAIGRVRTKRGYRTGGSPCLRDKTGALVSG